MRDRLVELDHVAVGIAHEQGARAGEVDGAFGDADALQGRLVELDAHQPFLELGALAGADLTESPVEDGEWFEYHIIVKGKRIILKINGETTLDYTEPDDVATQRDEKRKGRVLNPKGGLIALQAHDPVSVVYFRNIRIKTD